MSGFFSVGGLLDIIQKSFRTGNLPVYQKYAANRIKQYKNELSLCDFRIANATAH